MNKKLKSVAMLLFTGIMGGGIYAQTGNVGVNTETPTEVLDVNGITRVRNLPNSGQANAIHTTGTNTKNNTATETFTPESFVVADQNGVLGKSTKADSADPSALNNSQSIFVIQRIELTDWPSGKNGGKGYDTGMSTAKWEAILSVPKIGLTAGSTFDRVFAKDFGFVLGKDTIGAEETWVIHGDVFNKSEIGYADVLFIKKEFVSVTPNRINDTQSQ